MVANGVMYLADSQSNVYAYDATNGTLLWKYTPTWDPGFVIGGGGRQPGVSVGQGFVFLGQRDGRVVALNQANGSVAWAASTGPWQKGIRLSETPMYYNGEVIEGNSGADGGSDLERDDGLQCDDRRPPVVVEHRPRSQPAGW